MSKATWAGAHKDVVYSDVFVGKPLAQGFGPAILLPRLHIGRASASKCAFAGEIDRLRAQRVIR